MKLRKKALITALVVTMISATSLKNENTFLDKCSVSYAVGEISDINKSEEVKDEMLEYLKDVFRDTINNDAFKSLKNSKVYSQASDILKQDKTKDDILKQILNLKEEFVNDRDALYKNDYNAFLEKLKSSEKTVERKENIKNLPANLGGLLDYIIESIEDINQEDGKVIIDNEEFYKAYVEYKANTRKEISDLISKLQVITNETTNKSLDETISDKVNKAIKDAKDAIDNTEASKNELLKVNKDLTIKLDEVNKILDKNNIEEKKLSVNKKIEELKSKIEKNKSKLSDDYIKNINSAIEKIKEELENISSDKIDKLITQIDQKDNELNDIIREFEQISKIKELEKEIEDSKNLKETQSYYRASATNRGRFVKIIEEAEQYLSKVKSDESIYKDEIANALIKELNESKNILDGMDYVSLLFEAKKDFDSKKDYLSEESIKVLQNKYDILSNMKNKDNTVDDIKSFINLLDKEFKNSKKVKEDKKDSSKVKKVAVSKTDSNKVKKSKSIVKTGIDSIKIFGVVAVIAIVLLVITSRKKDK